MKIPGSDHFAPVDLEPYFNEDRSKLDDPLRLRDTTRRYFGEQVFRGIPFQLGRANRPNVVLLGEEELSIQLPGIRASYLLFLHSVENAKPNTFEGYGEVDPEGNEMGSLVSEYELEYEDSARITTPILRRFAIQQSRIGWGASAFAAAPDADHLIFPTMTEDQTLGNCSDWPYGRAETRVRSGRDFNLEEILWIYALPNPEREKPLRTLRCKARNERSLIYGLSHTLLVDHPLRPGVREKLRLRLPAGAKLNELGVLEEIDIDLGQVISARAALDYDPHDWQGKHPNVQPTRSTSDVVVEYSAHPRARLYVGTGSGDPVKFELAMAEAATTTIQPARRPVRIKTIDRSTGQPVAVRLHLHGQQGEYLPPKGYHRQVNGNWFEDNYGEFVNGLNQYCYIPGECEADLPLGDVFVEITRGYEMAPIRSCFQVTPETDEMTFELERVLDWRQRGWVSADTHVHFLSPQTARLEGEGEGVNVVNLLASQWGEMFSNVSDFDGKTTVGAREFGGDGEFLVRVGTENRMQVLGHISLLGYAGPMIHPLCSGGPSESALGDPLELTMADWAQRCMDQKGLVVMPHGPRPQCERATNIVLDLVHAVEMMAFNPFDAQIDPFGIADWYRFLSLGYHVPICGGTDKMSAASLLGGIRTYTHLADDEFTYENWMGAMRRGNTFVTVGPLLNLEVEGQVPGGRIELPESGGTLNVSWEVQSVSLPIDQVEVVVGGLIAERESFDKPLSAKGNCDLSIEAPTWIALRVRGSYRGEHGEIAAHSSAIQVKVGDAHVFSRPDATAVLDQIEGAIAYVDTLAPRPEANRYKKLRATLEAAHRRLHQRMHREGVFHEHVLHDHEHPHEH